MTGKPDDASREGAQMSFDGRMSYSDYLHLERVAGRARAALGRA